jgi:cellulose synthase/poly-beta-1,6-N-acetylglucosamine synthase-like glycosyltransferase
MSVQLTVGIVARNEEEYITQTLESLINQDFNHSEFEIILIDGNSLDNTRKIACEVLENTDIEFRVINEVDFGSSGLCFARNLVIDQSNPHSRYIAYTDADCILARDWLTELYKAIEGSNDEIAGAGGPRLIAPTSNKKELVINAFITSLIASGGNPAFSRRNVKYLKSIPNYNAIYKKDIFNDFRYDDGLMITDDHELNYRLHKAGYLFKYVISAKVYHRETSSLLKFTRNMFRYGFNMTSLIKKHHNFKVKLILTLIFLFYLILLIPLYLILGNIVFIPPLFYLIFTLMSFGEVLLTTRTVYAFLVFLLMPLQHLAYALGSIYNFISKEVRV